MFIFILFGKMLALISKGILQQISQVFIRKNKRECGSLTCVYDLKFAGCAHRAAHIRQCFFASFPAN